MSRLKNLNHGKVSTPSGDDVGVENGADKNIDLILSAYSENRNHVASANNNHGKLL
jgi:hypothetical protein